MREQLVGYLLDALQPAEREALEDQLAHDRQLQAELELLRNGLDPLDVMGDSFAPPVGLAQRSTALVARQIETDAVTVAARSAGAMSQSGAAWQPGSWRLIDWIVAAGVLAASVMLFIPALQYSRNNAQLAACQNNLRELWLAQVKYARQHGGKFPDLQMTNGMLASAGIYAPKLQDKGFIVDPRQVVCPSAVTSMPADFHIPTAEELIQSKGDQLARLRRTMGGSYGYHIGYVSNGKLKPTQDQSRSKFALMADAPTMAPNLNMNHYQSLNHGGSGRNVLFEDGRVQYQPEGKMVCEDEIYCNDDGELAPGLHANDSVIGHSGMLPIVFTGGTGN